MDLGPTLLVDANVLIDYARTEVGVLGLVGRYVGPVLVPRELLGEVRELDEAACVREGLRLVEGTLEQLLAAARRRARLSFQDQLCLVLARDGGWTCVSNDKQLRAECARQQVPVRWGLELLVELVERQVLPPERALELAHRIQRINRFITPQVVADFGRRLLVAQG